MDWGQILVILIPLVTFMGFIWREIRDYRKETRDETNSIRAEIAEIRKENRAQSQRTDAQSQRTDKLYEMFIALLERQSPKTNP